MHPTTAQKRIGGRRWVWRLLTGAALLVVLLLGAGYAYQRLTTAVDFRRFPAPGQLVDVGGYRLHIFCLGEGSPTVIVDAGLGDFSNSWGLVQREIAGFTRICTYDRAGYGWSDPPGPGPRTSRQIAGELHALLEQAGIAGPYVLVGHSFGGLNVRLYASLYPAEVAGVVLVDASHEDQLTRMPAAYTQLERQSAGTLRLVELAAQFGLLRLWGAAAGAQALPINMQGLPAAAQAVELAFMAHPAGLAAARGEFQAFEESCAQVRAAGDLGDRPLVVLTAGNSFDIEALQELGLPADFPFAQLQAMQNELAALSTHSTHLVAEGSGHAIHLEQPDWVVTAIREVVEKIPAQEYLTSTPLGTYQRIDTAGSFTVQNMTITGIAGQHNKGDTSTTNISYVFDFDGLVGGWR
jgi:pimeloyl-ACP methyl ester carboxylesterase